jgi:uncharacterized oxidoreductase
MKMSGNTILITGGASGIGLGLAVRLMDENQVIVCGRSKTKLAEVHKQYPSLQTFACDLEKASERQRLFDHLSSDFPMLNILINNAGIQRRKSVLDVEAWADTASEFAINFEAPVHLSKLFIPHFLKKENAAINVTSGLAFAPIATMPVYCATKAALHSFTLSLRHSLKNTPIEVIEMIPPAVQTDLGGKGLHDFGVPLKDFSDAMIQGLREGETEISYGTALTRSQSSRAELDQVFKAMNP